MERITKRATRKTKEMRRGAQGGVSGERAPGQTVTRDNKESWRMEERDDPPSPFLVLDSAGRQIQFSVHTFDSTFDALLCGSFADLRKETRKIGMF